MPVKGVFRSFIEGLMLLMLASFILTSISYIANTIPETDLTIGDSDGGASSYIPAQFIGEYSLSSWSCSSSSGTCSSVYTVSLGSPPTNMSYLIVVPRVNVTIYAVVVTTSYRLNTVSNGTHSFAKYTGKMDKVAVEVNGTSPITDRIKIYAVDSRVPLPPPSGYLGGGQVEIRLSNKLIINFIAWVASIAIMLTALHKMGVSI